VIPSTASREILDAASRLGSPFLLRRVRILLESLAGKPAAAIAAEVGGSPEEVARALAQFETYRIASFDPFALRVARWLEAEVGGVTVVEHNCGTGSGIRPFSGPEGGVVPTDRILRALPGRVVTRPIVDPASGRRWIEAGKALNSDFLGDDAFARHLREHPEDLEIRSPVTCETGGGVCAGCVGRRSEWLPDGHPVGQEAVRALYSACPPNAYEEREHAVLPGTVALGAVEVREDPDGGRIAAGDGFVRLLPRDSHRTLRVELLRLGIPGVYHALLGIAEGDRIYRVPAGSRILVEDGEEILDGRRLFDAPGLEPPSESGIRARRRRLLERLAGRRPVTAAGDFLAEILSLAVPRTEVESLLRAGEILARRLLRRDGDEAATRKRALVRDVTEGLAGEAGLRTESLDDDPMRRWSRLTRLMDRYPELQEILYLVGMKWITAEEAKAFSRPFFERLSAESRSEPPER
jgi:hypothetical protein